MANDIYLHGIETTEQDGSPRASTTINTGVIGLVGTAPDASETDWPLDTAIAVLGAGASRATLGQTGTLYDALDGIFDQSSKVSQTVVLVRVQDGADVWKTMGKIIGDQATRSGMYALLDAPTTLNLKPKLLIAPGFTSQRPSTGVASITVGGTGGVGYISVPDVTITGDGHGAKATAVINSSTGKVTAIKVDNPGVGYTAATVTLSGGGATTQATATATIGTVANPVATELLVLSRKFRAGVIKAAPATTYAAAIADRGDYDTDRMLIVEPMVKIFKDGEVVNEPPEARVAGLQANVDYTEGFWFSPSNHVVQGVVGTSRAIEHSINDAAVESQQLNKSQIACIIRSPSGGFKLWGSRVPSSDTLKQFWSVRRAHDTIIDSIELACEPYIDKPFGPQILVDIAETVNRALRRWAGMGATLGGRVWLDPALNTAETWVSGHLYINYDAEGPAPIEHITFIFSRNTGYYDVLAANAVKEIARLTSAAIAN